LALNDECFALRRGCFYLLPLREGILAGHPADMVFVDELWNNYDLEVWTGLSPCEKVELCDAGKLDAPFLSPECLRCRKKFCCSAETPSPSLLMCADALP
jgi:hypothetical protein